MEMTKETRNMIITSLYDKYGRGEISSAQREQLIQKINDKFYTEMVAITTEKAEAEKENKEADKSKELSPKEKFDKFEETVNTKCKDGEITEEFRDQLLEKAREKFLPKEDNAE